MTKAVSRSGSVHHAAGVDAFAGQFLQQEPAHMLVADTGNNRGFQAQPRRAHRHVGRGAADIFLERDDILEPSPDLGSVEVDAAASKRDQI